MRLIKIADVYDNLCDALDLSGASARDVIRRNALKAERVLEAAGSEAELVRPKRILRELVQAIRLEQLGPGT